jgi:hypothetical protein
MPGGGDDMTGLDAVLAAVADAFRSRGWAEPAFPQ